MFDSWEGSFRFMPQLPHSFRRPSACFRLLEEKFEIYAPASARLPPTFRTLPPSWGKISSKHALAAVSFRQLPPTFRQASALLGGKDHWSLRGQEVFFFNLSYIYLFIHLFVYLFIQLFIYLSLYIYI